MLDMPAHLTAGIGCGLSLPTPTANDAKNTGGPGQHRRNTAPLNARVGGKLSPMWVAWLMGWPIGWTGLEPLGTDRFLAWQRSHGVSSGGPDEP